MWQDYVSQDGSKSILSSVGLLQDVLCLKTDSYKVGHWKMLAEDTDNFFSYGEARGAGHGIEKTVMFGLQAIIKKYFLKKITMRDIMRAKRFADRHLKPGAFNYEGWKYIVDEYDGYLPLEIWAVPEGTVLNPKNVLYYVQATDAKCKWLVSYFEPLWFQVWYPITVASLSYQIRKNLSKFWQETVDDDRMGGLNFALHDFGFRGVSSPESAGIGDAGHLMSFMGTDTMMGIAVLYDYYGLDEEDDNSMPGFSVYASEHSVACALSNAETKNDYAYLEAMVALLEKEGGIVSAVADTYDPYRFTKWVGTDFKERIEKSGGRFVVRPDSGDPKVVPVQLIEMLLQLYGYTINKKGFKVLPDCIRVLQGDGITIETINEICLALRAKGISVENIVFGMGGGLLQHCDRDWLKFAQKTTAMLVDDKWIPLQKDPITDPGKQSKKGRVETVLRDGEYTSINFEDRRVTDVEVMQRVFFNGALENEVTAPEIRQRVQATF
jgi:nicotinamide phosphoribosyltransferase